MRSGWRFRTDLPRFYFIALRLTFLLLAADFLAISGAAILGIVRFANRDSVPPRHSQPYWGGGTVLELLWTSRGGGHSSGTALDVKISCVSQDFRTLELPAVPRPGIREFALRAFPGCSRTSSGFASGNSQLYKRILLWTLLQGKLYTPPPPLPPIFGQKGIFRGRGGGYFEAPAAGILYAPSPLFYAPPPTPRRVFSGVGGWGCMKFGPVFTVEMSGGLKKGFFFEVPQKSLCSCFFSTLSAKQKGHSNA